MKMINKNRKGFTLVEMMLSLAIIMLIGGVVVSLVVSISNSFNTTYNIDDSADYAMLYAKGFENSFLANSQKGGASGSECYWLVNKDGTTVPTLKVKTADSDTAVPVFDPQFLGTEGNSYKWEILMFYKWDEANECVLYRVLLKDNFNSTGFTYMYDGSFWVPRYTDRKVNNGATSRNITIDGAEMNEETLQNAGFDTSMFSSEQLDGSYKAVIHYFPG